MCLFSPAPHALTSLLARARSFLTPIAPVLLLIAIWATLSPPVAAQQDFFLVVSRVQYDGNNFGNPNPYPQIFNDPTVSGVQGSIHLDLYLPFPNTPALFSLPLPTSSITTSFSSKSEGALTRSVDGHFLTYIGYNGPDGAEGVSNSYTTEANLSGNANPLYDREVAMVSADGAMTFQNESNAYSGDNPRAVITVDGTQFYMAGNSDSTITNGTGPGTTIGARFGTPGSNQSVQLGVYLATDRPDESKKQHVKDNNFRGIGIYNGNLYVSKGSGGNGDDGIFQVEKGTSNGLPTGTGNTIVQLLGEPATDPVTGNSAPDVPFGFFFANPRTLYVADEGYPNLDANGNLIPDPRAGLQKWSLVNGTWQLDYILTDGLNLLQAVNIPGYPAPTYTYGLRNMTGKVNWDRTVTIYAITAQYSTFSNGEPDPTNLVAVTDRISATTEDRHHHRLDHFVTLQNSGYGQVFRGVAFAPVPKLQPRDRGPAE